MLKDFLFDFISFLSFTMSEKYKVSSLIWRARRMPDLVNIIQIPLDVLLVV